MVIGELIMIDRIKTDSIKIISSDINKKMIQEALLLDKKYYPPEYHLSLAQCLGYFEKNNQIYIMLENNNHVMGYLNFSPITEEKYNEIASGNCIDTTIRSDDICQYEPNHIYSAYLSSIVIEENYRNLGYGNLLLKILAKKIIDLFDEKIYFKRIIADVLNDAGRALAINFGLQEKRGTNNNSILFETVLIPIKMNKTIYNESIIDKYEKFKGGKDGI